MSIYDIAGRALRDVGGEDLPVWAEPLQQEPERLDAAPGLLQRDDVQAGDDFGDARHGMPVPFGESLGPATHLFVRLPNARTFQVATNSLVSPLAGIVLSSAPESLSKSCVTASGGSHGSIESHRRAGSVTPGGEFSSARIPSATSLELDLL